MYGIVREQGRALGQLSLYRPKAATPFSAAQRTDLTSVLPYIAHGLSQRARRRVAGGEFFDAEDDAIFLIGTDGDIRQQSLASQKLLALALAGKIGPEQVLAGIGDAVRPALRRLAQRLGQTLAGDDVGPPSLVVTNAWGRFMLRAYAITDGPLDSHSSIAVSIRRQEPMLLKFVDALNELELSPQQREVALGLAKGLTNRELADALGVSINTVAYNVKHQFQRLDTHDRQQMIARVLNDRPPPA
jgi:DNA-binding CsgD family transcriptional regulator